MPRLTHPTNYKLYLSPQVRESHNAEGKGDLRTVLPTFSVDTGVINFDINGDTSATWQPGHPSIEQDVGQCGPAAVANSLQWLEDTYGISISDDHVAGIRDDSLVGELDQAMERQPHEGVDDLPFMKGKLKYISDNGLADDLVIKHKEFGDNDIPSILTVGNATSREDTSDLTIAEWIHSEIQHGEDVEVGITWDDRGGHWVDLIGSGKVLDVPWIAWTHDAFQGFDDNGTSDDTTAENGGTNWFDGGIGWSPIVDNRLIAFIGGEFSAGTIDIVASESPKTPEPTSILSLLSLGIFGATATFNRKQKK
ncbi:hypothetical protein [Crocosphaera sp. XPORK-15E]|uniref:hypothetical protein n=1 Tax=Crocosphaera sp. XPORK-15E TaxID=3110247 RepID=UPI002B1ED5CA|nr:hypothetical protein [Crocosphaera sp. XPORK-15E]MEA5537126.1 hypothetical protein [Crocosphaera sp. XPORK-15E]